MKLSIFFRKRGVYEWGIQKFYDKQCYHSEVKVSSPV